jgi:hypothetical protein
LFICVYTVWATSPPCTLAPSPPHPQRTFFYTLGSICCSRWFEFLAFHSTPNQFQAKTSSTLVFIQPSTNRALLCRDTGQTPLQPQPPAFHPSCPGGQADNPSQALSLPAPYTGLTFSLANCQWCYHRTSEWLQDTFLPQVTAPALPHTTAALYINTHTHTRTARTSISPVTQHLPHFLLVTTQPDFRVKPLSLVSRILS